MIFLVQLIRSFGNVVRLQLIRPSGLVRLIRSFVVRSFGSFICGLAVRLQLVDACRLCEYALSVLFTLIVPWRTL